MLKTANSQQFFNINFDKALKLNVLTLGDSGDIYWAPSNLATNDFLDKATYFLKM